VPPLIPPFSERTIQINKQKKDQQKGALCLLLSAEAKHIPFGYGSLCWAAGSRALFTILAFSCISIFLEHPVQVRRCNTVSSAVYSLLDPAPIRDGRFFGPLFPPHFIVQLPNSPRMLEDLGSPFVKATYDTVNSRI
jgi:hypothetical protein